MKVLSINALQCDQYEYKFTQKCNLNTHKKSIHKGIKYECDQCEYKATETGSLKKHKMSIHKQ